MNKEFENVKTSKLISGPKFAFHSPYLNNSECIFSAVLSDRHTFVSINKFNEWLWHQERFATKHFLLSYARRSSQQWWKVLIKTICHRMTIQVIVKLTQDFFFFFYRNHFKKKLFSLNTSINQIKYSLIIYLINQSLVLD